MSDFKSEYRQAVDRLEPDGRLIESLKADIKAAAEAPPKPNFFVRYRWAFGSAAACLVLAASIGVFMLLGSGGLNMMSEGGSSANMAAANDDYLAENAPYGYGGDNNGGVDGDIGDSSDIAFNDGDYVDDGYGGGAAVTTTSYANEPDIKAESVEADIAPTEAAGDSLTEDTGETRDYYVAGISAERIEALRAVSYEELKSIVDRMGGMGAPELTLEELMQYDFIEDNSAGYRLLLRYDGDGISYPIVASFYRTDPSAHPMVLAIYRGYNAPCGYIELGEVDDDIDYYLASEYWYTFDNDTTIFNEELPDKLASMTAEQLNELKEKAEAGTLTFGDFQQLDYTAAVAGELYTLISAYTDGSTKQGYVLVAHFIGGEDDTKPDHVILRKRDSDKELDLLNEYYLLDRFLS